MHAMDIALRHHDTDNLAQAFSIAFALEYGSHCLHENGKAICMHLSRRSSCRCQDRG